MFGYSMTFPKEFWATDSTAGTCYPGHINMKFDIQQCDSLFDFVIVNFHWGAELKNFPKQYQQDFAHQAIDAGADLIIGHHPHVLQGLEIYKNRLIAYSLGNFSFASYSKNATESIVLKILLSEDGLIYAKLIPVSVNNIEVAFQPTVLSGLAADSVLVHLKKKSTPLNSESIIDESGFIWGEMDLLKRNVENRARKQGTILE